MPKNVGYGTGGKVPPAGDHEVNSGSAVDIYAASMGTTRNQPVGSKDNATPGGYGSTGSKSDSSPAGMKGSKY